MLSRATCNFFNGVQPKTPPPWHVFIPKRRQRETLGIRHFYRPMLHKTRNPAHPGGFFSLQASSLIYSFFTIWGFETFLGQKKQQKTTLAAILSLPVGHFAGSGRGLGAQRCCSVGWSLGLKPKSVWQHPENESATSPVLFYHKYHGFLCFFHRSSSQLQPQLRTPMVSRSLSRWSCFSHVRGFLGGMSVAR